MLALIQKMKSSPSPRNSQKLLLIVFPMKVTCSQMMQVPTIRKKMLSKTSSRNCFECHVFSPHIFVQSKIFYFHLPLILCVWGFGVLGFWAWA